mgnify:CR=1 FL=1
MNPQSHDAAAQTGEAPLPLAGIRVVEFLSLIHI